VVVVVVEAAAVAAAVFDLAGTYGLASRHVPQLRSRLSALGWKEQKVRPSLPLPTFLPSTLPPSLFLFLPLPCQGDCLRLISGEATGRIERKTDTPNVQVPLNEIKVAIARWKEEEQTS
jgi:hypothetical protein